MLQKIREHTTGWVAALILGAIALSFIFFGIDFGTPGANTAIRVNGEEVPRFEYDNLVRQNINRVQQTSPDALTPELEQLIRAQSVDLMVTRELVDQAAEARGFRVTDAQLAAELRAIPNFQVDGTFDRQLYYDTLAANNRNSVSFEADLRRDLERQQVQASFQDTAFVTTAEVSRRAALLNQTRTVDYLTVPQGLYTDAVEVTEADIQQRYEDFAEVYTTPERVELQYLELRIDDIAADMEVTEDELREAYAAGLDSERFRTPEERRASHILVQSGASRSPDEARARAEELLAQLEGGADFAELAATASDDTSSAAEGGDLGWIAPGTLDEALVDTVFSTAPGEIAGPVETPFGWHLVKVTEQRGGEVTPFDDVRDQLRAELQRSRADGRFIDAGEELSRLTFQNSRSLEPAARALGLEIRTVGDVTRTSGARVAANAQVRDAAFAPQVLEEGLNSEVVELEFGHLVVVRVVDREPAELRPLEDVRDSIVSVVRAQKARERARERGQALAERLAAGEPLAALAAELGEGVEPVDGVELTRRSRDVPTQLVEAVFAEPTPAAGEVVTGGVSLLIGDYVVYRLTDVSEGQLSEAEGAQLRAQLTREQAAAEFTAYLEALRADADIFVARDIREPQQP